MNNKNTEYQQQVSRTQKYQHKIQICKNLFKNPVVQNSYKLKTLDFQDFNDNH